MHFESEKAIRRARDLWFWCLGIIAAHAMWRNWPEIAAVMGPAIGALTILFWLAYAVRTLFAPKDTR